MMDVLFSIDELMTFGVDAVVYSALALIGSLLFILRLGFSVFGGVDSDFDLDVDSGTDASFGFVSVLSILAFFMGAGWMGLACTISWGMGHFVSGLAAAGFGTLMMIFAGSMMFGLRKLTKEAHYDLKTAIGHTAQVYLTIPARGKGRGQVTVTVSGRKKVLFATSTGKEIKAFTAVKVVAVEDDDSLIVELK
jgi:hypothetical protein